MPPLRSSMVILHSTHPSISPSAPRHHHFHTHHGAIRKRPRDPFHPKSRRHTNPRLTASFTSTSHRSAREENHYETLDLPVTATADEIKKKFYALSLKHHPDRNRTDSNAGQRFARISAAYNVLGNVSKRQSYDRDNGFHHAQHAHRYPPPGSHSSHSTHSHGHGHYHHAGAGATYAGSRPASGLSKRRGTFTGPPPSFYANGGYGRTGRTADEGYKGSAFGFGDGSSTSGFGSGSGSGSGFGSASAYGAGPAAGAKAAGFEAEWGEFSAGMGQGQARAQQVDPEDPFRFIYQNPLHHFNARAHFRTQRAEDRRRGERRSQIFRAVMKEKENSGGGGAGGFRPNFGFDFVTFISFSAIMAGCIYLGEYVRDSVPWWMKSASAPPSPSPTTSTSSVTASTTGSRSSKG